MKSIPALYFLPTLLAIMPVVSAHNMVKFINHCPYDFFFWQVGPSNSGIDGSDAYRTMVPGNGGSIVHAMRDTEALGGGLSLKIRDLDYYAVAPAGIIQVEYHLEPSKGTMWYDLSAVDCDHTVGPGNALYCPLIQGGIKLYVPGGSIGDCPTGSCDANGCTNAYVKEGGYAGEPSWVCKAGADLFFETCVEKAGQRTFFGEDVKAPAAVHQAIPEPVSLKELEISPNGECGPRVGMTCAGSQHGVCCSEYGYCGDKPEYCNAGCQPIFGYCLGENETHRQVAASDRGATTATSVVTQTTTAMVTKTKTETKEVTVRQVETVGRAAETVVVTVLKTVTTAAVFTPPSASTRYSGKMFTGYPRRYAAAYVNL